MLHTLVFAKNDKEKLRAQLYLKEKGVTNPVFAKPKDLEAEPDQFKKQRIIVLVNPTSFHNGKVLPNICLLDNLYEIHGRFICIEPSFDVDIFKPLDLNYAYQFFIWHEFFFGKDSKSWNLHRWNYIEILDSVFEEGFLLGKENNLGRYSGEYYEKQEVLIKKVFKKFGVDTDD